MVTQTRSARTQRQRSDAMQRRLLDATVSALFDKGYGGTTLLEVQQRAAVSRGALLHHYGSRRNLMLAAVNHVSRERIAGVLAAAQQRAPDEDRAPWAIRVLWSTFDGPLFIASLELWLAARYDPDLLAALVPQERLIGQAIRSMAGDLFGPQIAGAPNFDELLRVLIDAMRGAAARGILRAGESDDRLLASWCFLMDVAPSTRLPGRLPAIADEA